MQHADGEASAQTLMAARHRLTCTAKQLCKVTGRETHAGRKGQLEAAAVLEDTRI